MDASGDRVYRSAVIPKINNRDDPVPTTEPNNEDDENVQHYFYDGEFEALLWPDNSVHYVAYRSSPDCSCHPITPQCVKKYDGTIVPLPLFSFASTSKLQQIEWIAAVDFGRELDPFRAQQIDFVNVNQPGVSDLFFIDREFATQRRFCKWISNHYMDYMNESLVGTGTYNEQLFLQRMCLIDAVLINEVELGLKKKRPVPPMQQHSARNSYYRAWRQANLLQQAKETLVTE